MWNRKDMNIYLISRTDDIGFYQYDSAVVAAESQQAARETHPFRSRMSVGEWDIEFPSELTDLIISPCFSIPESVKVELIGTTTRPAGVILASFNTTP